MCLSERVNFVTINENNVLYSQVKECGNFKQLVLSFQFLKKVQRQERVIEEVKLSLKPFYNKKTIGKDDYKDIMRKCVQKVSDVMRHIVFMLVKEFSTWLF